jgi:thiol-disulfide isomerase/thioredoxin
MEAALKALRLAAIVLVLALGPAAGVRAAMRPVGTAPADLSSLRGKVVVLNFWATWCVPCVRELPDLATLARRFDPAEVAVVAVAAEPHAETDRVVEFLRDREIDLPLWIGADGSDMAVFGLAETLPATVVLDRNGTVVLRVQGTFEPADLRRHVADALAGRAPDHAHEKVAEAKGGSRVPS